MNDFTKGYLLAVVLIGVMDSIIELPSWFYLIIILFVLLSMMVFGDD